MKIKKPTAWAALCAERNRRLDACLWAVMPDAPLTPEQKEQWVAYRLALHNIAKTTLDPLRPDWPKTPN